MYRLLITASLIILLIPLLLGCEEATEDGAIIETIETEEGIYEGGIKDSLPHGEGYFEYYGLGSYEGGFAEGEFHGYGVFDVPGFFKYEGEYYEGEQHGYGIETGSDGDRYEGEWYQGQKHGEGTETWADGRSYTGTYQYGNREGEGFYTWPDGRTYEGEFSGNTISGFGTMILPDGRIFTGNWEAGLMSGEGKWVYESGATFSGKFEDGSLIGEGIWTINGNEYEDYFTGGYRNDLPYGEGERYYVDGTKAIGAWDEQGKATDSIVFFESNGGYYEGEISAGFPEGWGNYYAYLHDYHYEGEWKANLRHGQGSVFDLNGNLQYEGLWEDDEYISGVSSDPDADYSIDFENGTIPLGELAIGVRVVDLSWEWEFHTGSHYGHEPGDITMPVTWIVVAHDHYNLDEGHVTLLSEGLIGQFSFDRSTDRGSDYGSNHWGDSGTTNASHGLRPWLNSSDIHSGEGFYQAFSEGFRNAALNTSVPNKEENNREAGSAYSTSDNVFIPSTTELGDTLHDRTYEIGSTYPYYSGAGDEKRIAKLGGEPIDYWTRSTSLVFSEFASRVDSSGTFGFSLAFTSGGVRPALNLKSDIMVSEFND